ncbi:MAG: hypothetical protein MK034_08750 [Dehalococcoidia bacterium]|mgnify:CR=1 FL=1|nr:hypothetical protein [Dehalococcoidia bacterium]|tara:strand:- start:34 stop:225 length:192 start_codon:yes stop_codon:yes gene_type:complete
MDETKIKTGTFKYVNLLQTGDKDSITMTIDGVKYGVPLDEANTDYAIIKRLAAAGTITIADAD